MATSDSNAGSTRRTSARRDDAAVAGEMTGGSRAGTQLHLGLWLLVVLAAGLTVIALKPPLSDVHYDTPYYLYQSKRLVETPFYASYLKHADEVAREVIDKSWDENLSYFPQRYWYFSRLGHLTTLAGFVALGNTGQGAVLAAHWGFGVLLAISLCLLLILTLQLAHLFAFAMSYRYLLIGAGITAVLFAASGQYWHLAGNLVTEVSAIFYLSATLTALTTCLQRRSWWLAALAGLTAFMAYASRPDFLLAILIFGVLIFVMGRMGSFAPRPLEGGLFAAAAVAVTAYGVYAWFFYPLPDPRLYLRLAAILDTLRDPPWHFFRLFIISGGLLWVGFVLAVPEARRHGFVRFGLGWLALSALPLTIQAFSGGPAQARMFSVTLPGLFVVSAAGWSFLVQGVAERAGSRKRMVSAIAAVLILLTVTHSATYAVAKDLPGGWRLQYVRSFLWPDAWENRSYHFESLVQISDALYGDGDLKVVVLYPSAQKNLELTNAIRSLGPRFPPNLDSLLAPEPQKVWRKGNDPERNGERVVFHNYLQNEDLSAWQDGRYRLFFLGSEQPPEQLRFSGWAFTGRPVVRGAGYWLVEATGVFASARSPEQDRVAGFPAMSGNLS